MDVKHAIRHFYLEILILIYVLGDQIISETDRGQISKIEDSPLKNRSDGQRIYVDYFKK